MRQRSPWSLHNVLVWVSVGAIILSAALAGLLKLDATKLDATLRGSTQRIQGSTYWLIPLLSGIAVGSKALAARLGPPRLWESVQNVLNRYRSEAFSIDPQDGMHAHRVTLFKRTWTWNVVRCLKKRRLPWSGWLVPVMRSGHTRQKTGTIFLAPDDAENAEGLIGRVWAGSETIVAQNLPDLSSNPSADQIAEYARQGCVPEEWVRERLRSGKSCARSLCCIRFEVRGRPWGVIVLDSAKPDALKIKGQSWKSYEKLMPFFLEELIKARG